MNEKTFKHRSFIKTLTALCQAHGEPVWRNGQIAQTYLAGKTGIGQYNFSRWISEKTLTADDDQIKKLAKYFKITPAQMRGEQPIETIDGIPTLTPEDDEFIELYKSYPAEARSVIREVTKLYGLKK